MEDSDDEKRDVNYEPERQSKSLSLEHYYSWERMVKIAAMCEVRSRSSVAKYLKKDKSQVNAIVNRVAKGRSQEFENIELKERLLAKYLEEDNEGTVIHDKTLIGWCNEIMSEMGIDKVCSRSFVDRFKRQNNISLRNRNRPNGQDEIGRGKCERVSPNEPGRGKRMPTNETTNDIDLISTVTNETTNGTDLFSNVKNETTNGTDLLSIVTDETTNDTNLLSNVKNETTNGTDLFSTVTDEATNDTNLLSNVKNETTNGTDLLSTLTTGTPPRKRGRPKKTSRKLISINLN